MTGDKIPENALICRVSIEKVSQFEYSAILDLETCDNCRAADGLTAKMQSELPTTPNPKCSNTNGCRCVVVEIND